MRTRETMVVLAAAALAGSLAAGPAPAAADQQPDFQQLDSDNSGGIDRREFSQVFGRAGVYPEWDSDRDGWVTDEKLNKGLGDAVVYDDASSRIWDLGDGHTELQEDLLATGYFRTYDADGDDLLDESEWGALEKQAQDRGWFE